MITETESKSKEPFFQVGILVHNLERAMEELAATQRVTWGRIRHRRIKDWDFRLVFSMQGPPYIELIEGPPGSPWDATSGPRLDHLQFWSDDMEGETKQLEAAGVKLQTDGVKLGGSFRYFDLPSIGGRMEMIDSKLRAGIRGRWGIDGKE